MPKGHLTVTGGHRLDGWEQGPPWGGMGGGHPHILAIWEIGWTPNILQGKVNGVLPCRGYHPRWNNCAG